jgi:hypothetical protein
MIPYRGGCHCGRIRFEVLAPTAFSVSECNCSICAASGHLGLIVPKDRFTLQSGQDDLTEYTFNTGIATHLFCKHCGIKSFYIPRSHPDGVSVNARCLDPGTTGGMKIVRFDGQHWEEHYPKGRADGYPD